LEKFSNHIFQSSCLQKSFRAYICRERRPRVAETFWRKAMTMENQDFLLRTEEAAKRLGLSPKTLNIWRWKGVGPRFCRLGRACRYRPSDLDAFIAAGEARSTSDPGAAVAR
jgi:predicted DNA-binding transcriptional regulator AlpA